MNGHLEVAKWLHEEGAQLDAKRSGGFKVVDDKTPLDLATRDGRTAVVAWLQGALTGGAAQSFNKSYRLTIIVTKSFNT
eukprot:357891-Prymnesium_polylepis.1